MQGAITLSIGQTFKAVGSKLLWEAMDGLPALYALLGQGVAMFNIFFDKW
jgi:hypothetical protein